MLVNRSMPCCAVIPVLAYDDVGEAVDWLCETFALRSGGGPGTIAPSSPWGRARRSPGPSGVWARDPRRRAEARSATR